MIIRDELKNRLAEVDEMESYSVRQIIDGEVYEEQNLRKGSGGILHWPWLHGFFHAYGTATELIQM